MRNLIIRAISGLVYASIVVAAVMVGNYTLLAFISALLIIGMLELDAMRGKGTSLVARVWDIVVGLSIVIAAFLSIFTSASTEGLAAGCLAVLAVRLVGGLYLQEDCTLQSWAHSLFKYVYITVPLSALLLLYELAGKGVVMMIFVFIWINDTGAYLVGCQIGKHKLFERISPKKSWEGFFGGLAFCVIAGCVASKYIKCSGICSQAEWIMFAVTVSLFATWGDLIESLIKRNCGVKDSGKIMPGHGGILDRIDSLLLVAPMVLAVMLLLL